MFWEAGQQLKERTDPRIVRSKSDFAKGFDDMRRDFVNEKG